MTITQSEIKELNNECCQTNCSEQATYKVYWPGDKPKLICEQHKMMAKNVAGAMGTYVHTEKIDG
jgi:hypothetical protein